MASYQLVIQTKIDDIEMTIYLLNNQYISSDILFKNQHNKHKCEFTRIIKSH